MLVDYPGDGDTVAVGGETHPVEDGVVELDNRAELRTIARRHGLHPAEISHDLCGETIGSGHREGVPCGRMKPCPHHSGDD